MIRETLDEYSFNIIDYSSNCDVDQLLSDLFNEDTRVKRPSFTSNKSQNSKGKEYTIKLSSNTSSKNTTHSSSEECISLNSDDFFNSKLSLPVKNQEMIFLIKKEKKRYSKESNREAVRRFRERQKEEYKSIVTENIFLKKKLLKMNNETSLNSDLHLKHLVNSIVTPDFKEWIGIESLEYISSSSFVDMITSKLQESSERCSKFYFISQKIINLLSSFHELKKICE